MPNASRSSNLFARFRGALPLRIKVAVAASAFFVRGLGAPGLGASPLGAAALGAASAASALGAAGFFAAGLAALGLGALAAGFASAFLVLGAVANFSRICRTTGGSSEDDDDLTNSPASFR